MVVRKRKKVNKYRGLTTHGGGHRKKRRGAGSRGGRGNAGSGKRAGHKTNLGFKLGSKGFTSKSRTVRKSLNLNYFTIKTVEKLVTAGKVVKEGDYYLVDLKKMGYGKLLGTGNTKLKLKVTVDKFSSKAAEKIKSAGGEIVSSESEEKKTE